MPVITKKILENLISQKSGRLPKFCVGIPEKVLGFAEHLCAQQRKQQMNLIFSLLSL